jgi:hypothetical protein
MVALLELAIGDFQFVGALSDAMFEFQVEPAQFVEELLVAAFQKECASRRAKDRQQLVGAPRFEQEALRQSGVDGVDRGLEVRHAGHQDSHGPRRLLANPLEELDPRHFRQNLVGDYNVGGPADELVLPVLARRSCVNVVIQTQQSSHHAQHAWFVVDDQYGTLETAHDGPPL